MGAGYWHRTESLCCKCGNLRQVSPRYRGGGTESDEERAISWLKCTVCGEVTKHADLLEPGTPWRDRVDSPESTPYTLAARIERLEADGVDVRWSDDVTAGFLHRFADAPDRPLVVLSRARSCWEVLGHLEQAEQLIRDPSWRTHRIAWSVEQYTWQDVGEDEQAVRLKTVGLSGEDGPLAEHAERLVDDRRAGA